MRLFYITFRSVTHAQRGERLLQEANYRCALMRTPRWMEEQGCGYALKLWTKDIEGAAALLRENHSILRKIYVQHRDGRMEELAI